MPHLTNIGSGVFSNLKFTCPNCHKELKRIVIPILGRPYEVPCYGSCGCVESKLDGTGFTQAERVYARAGIPERYLRSKCDTMGYQSSVAMGRSLYVHGPNGTAKSCFAGSLAKALMNMSCSVRWENAKHFISEIQGMYNGRQTDALERAYACKVLVLDDIGKEQPTAYSISMLYELVEQRYGACRPIVVTSNFDRAELCARWAHADRETAEAIVSRLCDNCVVVEMDGEDRRLA